MKNKFGKYIVIGAIAIVGTMGYNLNISRQNTDFQFIAGNIEALANGETTSKKFKCYSIFTGEGSSISCATCQETNGTPPWYHFGSECTRP